MCKMPRLFLVIWLFLIAGADAAQILGIFQSVGRSQWGLAQTYLRALEQRGHHITVITTFPSSQTTGNWTEILIANPFTEAGDINAFEIIPSDFSSSVKLFFDSGEMMCNTLLKDKNVRALYTSDKKFDIIVAEVFFTECLLVFAHKLKVPVVMLSTFVGTDWMGHMVGNPNPYAYVPSPFLEYTTHMNFLERLHNTFAGIIPSLIRQVYYLPKLDAIMRSHLNDNTLTPLSELERQISMVLINYHFSQGCPRPLVPNMVEVGGLHIKPPKKLPQDILKFLDEAKDGAIFFSMGSNIKSSDWPEEKLAAFLKAFAKLRQRVLWKWEGDSLPGKLPNVKTGKWLPQSDVLAHNNVRAFITHGGLLSTQEATARGVPLVGIPFFMDQRLNIVQAVEQGYAVRLSLDNITDASVLWALDEVMSVTRYRDNAQRLSQIFNDRPMRPLDEAVYWTEYVLRHDGAPHLRSAALDLTWYQYLLLDVVALLSVTALVLVTVACVLIKAAARCLYKVAKCGTRPDSNIKSIKRE